MTCVLKMVGGPLDGGYLPVQHLPPPTHLAVYVPENKSWVTYNNEQDNREMAFDVYKIRSSIELPTRPPPDVAVLALNYQGIMSREDRLAVEQMVRERQQREHDDQNPS